METLSYEFYEIQSAKSLELINGLRKVSLFCTDQPDMYCFLWFKDEVLQQVQLVFDEKVIQWIPNQGWITAETNRRMETNFKSGIHKGVRTIHQKWNPEILAEGTAIIQKSSFPANYRHLLLEKLNPEKRIDP